MMATVRRVVCVLAAALCCTALGAAAADKSATSAGGIKARITTKEAEVQKARDALEVETKKVEEAANGFAAPLKKAKEAVVEAVKMVEAVDANAEAVNKKASAVFAVASKVVRALSVFYNKKLSSTIPETPESKDIKVADAQQATKNLDALLQSVTQTVSDTKSLLQRLEDAKVKAEAALQRIGSADANSRVSEAQVNNMVKDGRTAVTDAGTAVAASLVKAGKAYDIVLALQDAANETDVTAKAAMAAIKKIDGESSKDPKTTLKNAWRNSTGALSHARPIMWASEDLRKDGKATKFAKQAMAFIDAKLEAALRPTVSSRTAAESALQNVQNELTQLQEEARRLDQREKEELKKKEEELSRLQQAESPTTTTSVPSLKKSGVDGEKVLARRADSTSSNAAWVGAPLMLLLVCVAVW